jgi:hypothetical protein
MAAQARTLDQFAQAASMLPRECRLMRLRATLIRPRSLPASSAPSVRTNSCTPPHLERKRSGRIPPTSSAETMDSISAASN